MHFVGHPVECDLIHCALINVPAGSFQITISSIQDEPAKTSNNNLIYAGIHFSEKNEKNLSLKILFQWHMKQYIFHWFFVFCILVTSFFFCTSYNLSSSLKIFSFCRSADGTVYECSEIDWKLLIRIMAQVVKISVQFKSKPKNVNIFVGHPVVQWIHR